MQSALPSLHKWAYNRFYIDNIYQFVTHKIIFGCISKPIAWFDRHIIDGTMNLLATVTNAVSYSIRGLQSGNLQTYVWVFIMGAMAIATLILILI